MKWDCNALHFRHLRLLFAAGDLAAKRDGGVQKLSAGAVVGALPVLLELERTSGRRNARTAKQTRMLARTVALVVKVGHGVHPDPDMDLDLDTLPPTVTLPLGRTLNIVAALTFNTAMFSTAPHASLHQSRSPRCLGFVAPRPRSPKC